MIKANVPQDVRDALADLQMNRSFKKFQEWLTKSLEESRKENDDLEGILLTRNQGCCLTLAKILKAADKAE